MMPSDYHNPPSVAAESRPTNGAVLKHLVDRINALRKKWPR